MIGPVKSRNGENTVRNSTGSSNFSHASTTVASSSAEFTTLIATSRSGRIERA